MLIMRFSLTIWGSFYLWASLLAQADSPNRASGERSQASLLKVLAEELEDSMEHLVASDGTKPYYISYTITDTTAVSVRGSLGALHRNDADHQGALDADIRVGDYALDNTHQIRGQADGGRSGRAVGATSSAPIETDPIAVKHALWRVTDRAFKGAVDRFQRVKTDLKTTVEEESKAHDFSREEPAIYSENDVELTLD